MYQYVWDEETGGPLLTTEVSQFSKEPRPVYYRELDLLGFGEYFDYPRSDDAPIMWAEVNNYIYRGRKVAHTKGGALYTPPELILDDYDPEDRALQFVDIARMLEKNADIMEALTQETIKRVYNTYKRHNKGKNKVDVFHVSYSGGKDSEVLFDIVRRALPVEDFVVIFGDTGMEFPDTYDSVELMRNKCKELKIRFFTAKAKSESLENWKIFGPPSQVLRWCCSVHKTTPQLLKLREIVGKNDLIEMAFVGVRADESIKRSEYKFLSLGTKHKGQYSCLPLLNWSSTEVYLYIFRNELHLNAAYKKGNSRAGCLLCPMSGDRPDFIRQANYACKIDQYLAIIRETSARGFPTAEDENRFIRTGGWKARTNGRDILTLPIKYFERSENVLEIIEPSQDWRVWLKTLGKFVIEGNECLLNYRNQLFKFSVEENDGNIVVTIPNEIVKQSAGVAKCIKQVFRKVAYCVGCGECEADCQAGHLHFVDGKINIDDDCKHCLDCHKPRDGCLLYESLRLPKGTGSMNYKSLDAYADHAPKIEWIQSFFSLGDNFMKSNSLGSMMISMFGRFLRDAELLDKDRMTPTAKVLARLGTASSSCWGVMLVNLSHTPEIGWYVNNIPFDKPITRAELIDKLKLAGVKDRGARSITGAYKRILTLPFGSALGLGSVIMSGKTYEGIIRHHWSEPEPRVILYSLYKFAEKCGDHYQFTLTNLLDDSIERDGISPTRIFGLDRDAMIPILNGLSANYSDFINVSFTHDLDTISLRADKSSQDVLQLF